MTSKLSLQQILQSVFDEDNNALRLRFSVISTKPVHDEWDGSAHTLDLSQSSMFVVDLGTTAVTDLTLSNPTDGGRYTIVFDNADPAAVTWPANILWKGGSAPTLTADGVDIVTLLYDAENDRYFGDVGLGFALEA